MKLVEFCERQLRDIREDDIVTPWARMCNINRANNGADKFKSLCKDLLNIDTNCNHFIIQTYGCTLNCQYCYVTPDGIWGSPVEIDHYEITKVFNKSVKELSDTPVFHLMGGAPAMHLYMWDDLLQHLKLRDTVFHSDFLLNEGEYADKLIKRIFSVDIPQLYAVSLKPENIPLFYHNSILQKNLSVLNSSQTDNAKYYITFTGIEDEEAIKHYNFMIEKNIISEGIPFYTIPIKHFKSLDR